MKISKMLRLKSIVRKKTSEHQSISLKSICRIYIVSLCGMQPLFRRNLQYSYISLIQVVCGQRRYIHEVRPMMCFLRCIAALLRGFRELNVNNFSQQLIHSRAYFGKVDMQQHVSVECYGSVFQKSVKFY